MSRAPARALLVGLLVLLGVSDVFAGEVPNQPPHNFDLVYPEDGQTGVPTDVLFRWRRTRDPEDGPMRYELYVSQNTQFSGAFPVDVSALSHGLLVPSNSPQPNPSASPFAWMASLVLLGFGLRTRRRWRSMCLVLLVALALGACGDSGPQEEEGIAPNQIGSTVDFLTENRAYYWKVRAYDDKDDFTESQVFGFNTYQLSNEDLP